MRRCVLILLALAAPAFADATADLLTRADQAFAAADYKTAVALYQKVDGQLTDPLEKSALAERRRFAEKQLGTPAAAPATQPASVTVAARTPHVRPPDGQTLTITLHTLGNFEYDENDDKSIPVDVRKLDGAKVKVDGVMLPLDQAGRVTRFLLVNDMMSCCYGTAPKLQNVAVVELPKDKWMAAIVDRIAVEGTLRVNVKREDGFVTSIFQIEPASIKLAAE